MELTFRRPLNDDGVQRFVAEIVDDVSVSEIMHSFISFESLWLYFLSLPKSHSSA